MSWSLYRKSTDAWDAMLEDAQNATKSIDIEQYIFSNDTIGAQFLEVFRKKAKQGIHVRILCDAVGSNDFMDDPIQGKLKQDGIEIQFHNPVKPWRIHNISSWFLRDHRKIMVVDGRIAHVGGVGIEDRMRDWRDTHVRLEDEVAHDIQFSFSKMWEFVGRRQVGNHKRVQFRNKQIGLGNFLWLSNAPRFRARFIYHALIRAIRRSQRYVYLTAPYVVPSVRLTNTIRRARRRGVDVRILVPRASDISLVDIAGGSYYLLLLKWGVRIFQYGPEVLHAKTAVIDDRWTMIGSANLDNLSLVFNFEGNIATYDPQFIKEIKTDFLHDASQSHEVSHDEWIRRSWVRKFLEILTWPLHGIL